MLLRSGTVLNAKKNAPAAPAAPAPPATGITKQMIHDEIDRGMANKHVRTQIITKITNPVHLLLAKITESCEPVERLKNIIELWRYLLSNEDSLRLLPHEHYLFDVILHKTKELPASVTSLYQLGEFNTADAKKDLTEFAKLNAKVMSMVLNIKYGVL